MIFPVSESNYYWIGLKRHWKKILAVSFLFSVLYALIHGLLPSGNGPSVPPSLIAQQGMLPLAFIAYGVLWFGVLSTVFVLIQARIPGRALVRGLIYGFFFCLLTFVLYLEPLPNTATFSLVNMAWMLGDGTPLLLFGALIGLLLTTSGNGLRPVKMTRRWSDAPLVLAIVAVFFVGRLFSYTVANVFSAFSAMPVLSLAWVSIFGLTIGTLYYWLRPALVASSPISTAVFFAFAMFGVDMYLFNFAYFLIVATSASMIVDFLVRISIDVMSVGVGVLVFEYVERRAASSSRLGFESLNSRIVRSYRITRSSNQ